MATPFDPLRVITTNQKKWNGILAGRNEPVSRRNVSWLRPVKKSVRREVHHRMTAGVWNCLVLFTERIVEKVAFMVGKSVANYFLLFLYLRGSWTLGENVIFVTLFFVFIYLFSEMGLVSKLVHCKVKKKKKRQNSNLISKAKLKTIAFDYRRNSNNNLY